MSYQVLARKWRPRTFQEMVGQEHVVRMLINALETKRLHHAYLFAGTRGAGKTSVARLLAKCLNCETGITPTPCNTCQTCLSIDAGRFLDLFEVDAASRTKVEDTRELLENVQYAPTEGRFKVYLIDEVHMLSGHSFNALLKTLEEPPEHVKFLLATTDPKRLPITILSRCLQFNLKRIPATQITQQLARICTAEKVEFELPALEQLADTADGSMRDALSLLDQSIAFCGESIRLTEVYQMLGNVEEDYLFRLLTALAENNAEHLLSETQAIFELAPDFIQVLDSLLLLLHRISIYQTLNKKNDSDKVAALAARLTPEDVQLYYQIALLGKRDLPFASSPAKGFEMIMIRMLAFKPVVNVSTASPKPITPAVTKETATPPAPIIHNKPLPSTTTSDPWIDLLAKLKLSGMAQALASNCTLDKLTDQTVELLLSEKHGPMLNKNLISRLEEALSQHFNKPLSVNIKLSTVELNTAAKQHEQSQKAKLANAVETITTDANVQQIVDLFDATIDVNSIRAVET